MAIPKRILPLIVLSQFAGTSLWFVGNALLPELTAAYGLSQYAVSLLTSAVMMGFIAGTLAAAGLALADRFSASKLFFTSSVLAALCTVAIAFVHSTPALLLLRFGTGLCLAGIYPVGMKIAADWYEKGLGKALGFLVGALVLGTAFPHLLKNRSFSLPWKTVLYATASFATLGGLLMLWGVGDGPYRKASGPLRLHSIGSIVRSAGWRSASLGYFGHMWELYPFWGFVPLILQRYSQLHGLTVNVPLLSFALIGCGSISCVAGGFLSQRWGAARVAFVSLCCSGLCCFLSAWAFQWSWLPFLVFLFCWSLTVCPDSPQFSTLAAQTAPPALRGTALTLYNALGFLITTISLWLLDRLYHATQWWGGENSFLILGLGAVVGLPFAWRLVKAAKSGERPGGAHAVA